MAHATRQSSLVRELETSVEIRAPANKYYQMLASRPQYCQKATPDTVEGCDLQEGVTGKVGRVLSWNFVIDGQSKVLKERVEVLDLEKNLIKTRVIEVDMMKDLKSFFVTVQATPKKSGHGSVVKCKVEYERSNENVEYPDHPQKLLEVFVKATKSMDQVLSSGV